MPVRKGAVFRMALQVWMRVVVKVRMCRAGVLVIVCKAAGGNCMQVGNESDCQAKRWQQIRNLLLHAKASASWTNHRRIGRAKWKIILQAGYSI